ncbi:MAG: hypothetical protein ACREBW_02065 [Candidatus Micrarchaeaceae archaeon]
MAAPYATRPATILPCEDRNKCGHLDGLPSQQPACDNTSLATDRAPITHVLAPAPMRARPRKPAHAPRRHRRPSARPNEANASEGDNLYASFNAWATPSPNKKNMRCLCEMPRSAVLPVVVLTPNAGVKRRRYAVRLDDLLGL